MKNNILFTVLLLWGTLAPLNAQSWTGTSFLSHAILYSNPDTANIGIGTHFPSEKLHIHGGNIRITNSAIDGPRLKLGTGNYVQLGVWEGSHMLSFKANKYNFTNGNVGIGVNDPQYKLDVAGKVLLRAVDDRYGCSYLHWGAHKLIMGTPEGECAYNYLELKPGGSTVDSLFSQLTMYTAYSPSNHVARIKLNTNENSWINTYFNVGIGTDNPLYKLDVRGTVRADEIIVNQVSGADFVFDKSYILRPLSEVKEYVQQNQHLPEIPSAEEMQEKGVNINELQMQLLQKVEELTLYILQQEQRIQELESYLSK